MALKTFTIPDSLAGQKLENAVRRYLPELGEGDVRSIFAHRDVKLDGVRTRPDARVSPGQTVSVYYMAPSVPALDIVYEDSDVLLVNKRAGLSVMADPGGGVSMEELAASHAGGTFRPAPCHRLDNQTSGLLLFAKNPRALDILEEVFRSRSLDKRYTCLVRGSMKPPEAVCRAYLVKDARAGRVTIYDHEVPHSRLILTQYTTLATEGLLSRLEVHLITGRTHQIRAHLAALGHPLLGDDLYGDRALNRRLHAQGRLMLCATSLTLDTGGRLPALDGRLFHISCPF